MSLSVREATAGDWPAVAALLEELGRPGVTGGDDEDWHRADFATYLARADAVGLVAEREGRVVGFCDLEFRQRLNFRSPQAWIPDLIVTEAERGAGAGAALLARAEEISRARGAWGMTLESATWRTRAHAFYRREGWTDTGLAFVKLLREGLTFPPPPPGAQRMPES